MVRTNKNYLERNGEKLPIIPGMIASVDIITGKKTILDFVLKPILKTKQGALLRDSGLGNVFDFFDIKKVGIVLRPNSPELKSFFLEIKEAFELQNIEVLLELNSAHTIKYQKGVSFNKICKEADLFISVGGDGTLISVSRRCTQKPVLGVNLGNLGFLTELSKDEFLQILKKEKKVDFKIENRMLMQAEIGLGKFIAFNDIVITKKTVSSMINIKAKVNSMELTTQSRG